MSLGMKLGMTLGQNRTRITVGPIRVDSPSLAPGFGQSGTEETITPGTYTPRGGGTVVVTHQHIVGGVVVSTGLTYTPQGADIGLSYVVREIATETGGTEPGELNTGFFSTVISELPVAPLVFIETLASEERNGVLVPVSVTYSYSGAQRNLNAYVATLNSATAPSVADILAETGNVVSTDIYELTGATVTAPADLSVKFLDSDRRALLLRETEGGLASVVYLNALQPVANIAPVAVDDTGLTTPFETVLDIDVLANDTDADGDTLSLSGTPTATSGTVAYVGGLLRYTPATGFDGAVTLTYEVTDGEDTDTGSVSVTVAEEIVAPTPPEITAFAFDSIDGTALALDLTVSEACEVDWVMTTSTTAPTPSQVAAGTDDSDVAATASGTFTVAASGVVTSSGAIPTDLDATYAFHASAHDGSGTRSTDVDTVTGVNVNTTASGNSISSVTGSPTNTQDGSDEVYQFDANGSFVADANMTVTYLMVGGGGGGGTGEGFRRGGGGAGGEVVTGTFSAISGQTYNVAVGAGGAGGAESNAGAAGNVSSITTGTNAPGTADGGEGGGADTVASGIAGGSGTLGGGAGGNASTAGTGTLFAGGGNSGTGTAGGGAGAGGAGGDAENGGDFTSGAGGIGVSSTITGTAVEYGGGGAGGTDTNSGATQGGGGTGGIQSGANGADGTLGGGGGGGGGLGSVAGAGGPGRVTIKFSA